jgi:hypothetical protein
MWRAEPEEVRQKYAALAEADKRRYVDELRAYEAQRALEPPAPALPTRRVASSAATASGGASNEVSEPVPLPSNPHIDPAELYCRACQQYFVSTTNLKEHLSGRRHKLVVGEPVDQNIPDIPIFTKEFLEFNQSREQEMRVVRRAASQFEEQTRRLTASKTKLEETLASLNADAQRLVAENAVLLAQLNTLEGTVTGSVTDVLQAPFASAEDALARLETLARDPANHALVQTVLVQLMDAHGKRLQASQGFALAPQPGMYTPTLSAPSSSGTVAMGMGANAGLSSGLSLAPSAPSVGTSAGVSGLVAARFATNGTTAPASASPSTPGMINAAGVAPMGTFSAANLLGAYTTNGAGYVPAPLGVHPMQAFGGQPVYLSQGPMSAYSPAGQQSSVPPAQYVAYTPQHAVAQGGTAAPPRNATYSHPQ